MTKTPDDGNPPPFSVHLFPTGRHLINNCKESPFDLLSFAVDHRQRRERPRAAQPHRPMTPRTARQTATADAIPISQKWHSPVNDVSMMIKSDCVQNGALRGPFSFTREGNWDVIEVSVEKKGRVVLESGIGTLTSRADK
jgi:hypothetical protein